MPARDASHWDIPVRSVKLGREEQIRSRHGGGQPCGVARRAVNRSIRCSVLVELPKCCCSPALQSESPVTTAIRVAASRRFGTVSPLRYPGGKSALAGLFADLISDLDIRSCVYVEPYAGGAGAGVALLRQGLVKRLVINDIDPAVNAFWQSVAEDNDRFVDWIANVPLDLSEWRRQREIYRDKPKDVRALGRAFFYLNRTNRSGVLNAGRESMATAVVEVGCPHRPVTGEFAPVEFVGLTVEARVNKAGGLSEMWRAERLVDEGKPVTTRPADPKAGHLEACRCGGVDEPGGPGADRSRPPNPGTSSGRHGQAAF